MGQPKVIHNRETSGSSGHSLIQMDQQQSNTGPLTIVAQIMTDAEVDGVIKVGRHTNTEIQLRDHNGKVNQREYKNPNRGEEDSIENKRKFRIGTTKQP